VPWRLNDFGIFPNVKIPESRGAIWACSARLDDPLIRHIIYQRVKKVPSHLQDQYAELMGIRELRSWLRQKWTKKELRQKWLVLTGSVRFCKESRSLIEFDGGLIKLSTRSGRMTWYGLESKSGGQNPLTSLNRRLDLLGIKGNTYSISNKYAFLELPL